ncbi:hypothetical protein INS49_009466 [Diaporthe citri]|uniref:uncharacterized protein n=1 Tax=Diaporthe citri TaxID=83186 RepID=UPI001C80BE0B|nr:uncharacterized protein INS49_009466 [Diaporthe citri]KAG6361242.1 hypothetical protein INS49_009466 [Diaporthe citri]
MKFAGLLYLVANVAQLSSPAAIIGRDDSPAPQPYVLTRYEDTEPAGKYCYSNSEWNSTSPYSDTTVTVSDCVGLIWFLRGHSSRFEFSKNDTYNGRLWWKLAAGYGTCSFSLFPKDADIISVSLGSLDIEYVVTETILMNAHKASMNATSGVLLCRGNHSLASIYNGDRVLFLIHNAHVDHATDPTINATYGFAMTMGQSASTLTPTRV